MLVVKIILDCIGFYVIFIEEEYYTTLNCHKINPTSRIRQKHVHDENDLSSYNRKFNLPTSCSEKSKGLKSFYFYFLFYFILFYYTLLYYILFFWASLVGVRNRMWSKYLSNNVRRDFRLPLLESAMVHKTLGKSIFIVNLALQLVRSIVANGEIGSLKSLYTFL